jgi:hypothetical protein
MLLNATKPTVPAIPLHDPRFVYTPAAHTNVQATWARFGWVHPSQEKAHA